MNRYKLLTKLTTLLVISLLAIFLSIFIFSAIAEKFFFNKLIYQKSSKYGYWVDQNLKLEDFNERSADIVKLNSDSKFEQNSNEFHVALIGDSFVWGQGLKTKDMLSNKLESELDKLKPSKVYSLGLGGYSTLDYLDIYKKIENKAEVDMYVFVAVLNDILPPFNRSKNENDVNNIVKNCHEQYPGKTALFYPDWSKVDLEYGQQQASQSMTHVWNNEVNLCILKTSLSKLPKNNSIFFVPDYYSKSNERWDKYIELAYNAGFKIVNSQEGKKLLEFQPYWDNLENNFTVSKLDKHPSTLANKMYAKVLSQEIKNQYFK